MYDAFAQYGSGVLLVSVRDGDEDRFFVAASVLTASVDPFALAVSVGRRRPALAAMLDGGRWCVSVLQSDHRGLVEQLTGETTAAQRAAALTAAGAECSPEGVLWLPSALTTLWCTTASAVTVNDQMLLVGDAPSPSRSPGAPRGALCAHPDTRGAALAGRGRYHRPVEAQQGTQEIYLAGGCLWGVQAFVATLPGVTFTEAGRANGAGRSLEGEYDGYAECVRTRFDPEVLCVEQLMAYLFEIIDPYSVDRQGPDVGRKYRTGVYSREPAHLSAARSFIAARDDAERIAVEVRPLENYLRSADEHQDRLARFPGDSCHLPAALLTKYRR